MFRSRRGDIGASPLAAPIVINKLATPKHIDEAEVLQFLSNFISTKEAETNSLSALSMSSASGESEVQTSHSSNATQYISQLKRIERDFKGLPPTIYDTAVSHSKDEEEVANVQEEIVETEHGKESISKSVTGGTKKKFD